MRQSYPVRVPADHPEQRSTEAAGSARVVVVLDVANVMGSRPDGWWRDRAGAAERVLAGAASVLARGDSPVRRVVAVLEGRARSAHPPEAPGLEVVLAEGEGDDAVVHAAQKVLAAGAAAWVVTSDRGLRERLPRAEHRGPRWWFELVDGQK